MRLIQQKCKLLPLNRLDISCAFSTGISQKAVLDCVKWGKDIAKYIVLCDTDSNATAESIASLCSGAKAITPNLSIHLHVDEDSTAYINTANDSRIRQLESSVGGLGGRFSWATAQGNLRT